jgi:hypothetical protein
MQRPSALARKLFNRKRPLRGWCRLRDYAAPFGTGKEII